ncbi:hypothetical protein PSTT_14134 [Puccinia striiformis]|uniref:Uncharacterized protein n=1 Tax=Puccinia striiformis TaxID=27350 RepID=A0A2S4UNR5_9BASI|nr:hypothetical protein PSTT_14134 [Puccinia striiformis]
MAIIFGTSILSPLLSGHKHYLDVPLKPHLTRDFQSYLIVIVVVGSMLELLGLVICHSIFGFRIFGFRSVDEKIPGELNGRLREKTDKSRNSRAIPSGPFMMTFAIAYQHHNIVPLLYDYRIGQVHLDSLSSLMCWWMMKE